MRILSREFLRYVALPCLLYIILIFVGSEIIEHVYLNKLPDSVIHWLHFIRSVVSAIFVGVLVLYLLNRVQKDFNHQMLSVCALLNAARDGLIAFNARGSVVSANTRAFEILGSLDSGNFAKWKKGICDRMKIDSEIQCWNPDGTLRLRVFPLQSYESGTLLLIQDITDAKKMEEQWLIAEKMASIGRMAAGLAHEIGTPLNVISGRAELLQAALPHSESQQKHTSVILDQTERIAGIIQQLLTHARQTAEHQEDFSLNVVVRKAVDLLHPELDKKGIAVHLELQDELPEVYGFSDQFHQVVINLMTNAMDAMEGKQGSIQIATSQSDGCAQLAVVDTGCGICEEHMSKVFDPFFTTKEFGKGTGLGLTVTSNIVHSHGGTIEVQNVETGGTRFVVHLPRQNHAQAGVA